MPTTPQPIPTTSTTRLPCGVTFFLTHAQRARVLARLARHGPDRTPALLAALGLNDESYSRNKPRTK